MAQEEDLRAGKAGVVEVSIREALERRGLLGGERPTMRPDAGACKDDVDLAA